MCVGFGKRIPATTNIALLKLNATVCSLKMAAGRLP